LETKELVESMGEILRRNLVITSRKWDETKIEVFITDKRIGIHMDLNDFITAVIAEVGSPAPVMRRKTLRSRIEKAAYKIINEMKEQSAKIY
jgi:hypothetical protein